MRSDLGVLLSNSSPHSTHPCTCLYFQSLSDRLRVQYNLPNDGLGRWTTQKDKVIDPSLFRNEGYSYWETEEGPYKPSVCRHAPDISADCPAVRWFRADYSRPFSLLPHPAPRQLRLMATVTDHLPQHPSQRLSLRHLLLHEKSPPPRSRPMSPNCPLCQRPTSKRPVSHLRTPRWSNR